MMRAILLGLMLLLTQTACERGLDSCPGHFAAGAVPQFTNEKLAADTKGLCFEAYAVMHSGVSRTPLWSAEHLTISRLDRARTMQRKNTFHAEERLRPADRAELRDYVHSGFDRGHMSPSGDMPDAQAQYESFSLANMVPQAPKNNQILWEGIEESTRNMVRERGELYVITGPIFEGASLQRLNGRVLVPSHVFKAIVDPARHEAGAYVAVNANDGDYETLSIAELENRIGVNLFPKLSPAVKQAKMDLPAPQPHGYHHKKSRQSASGPGASAR